MSIIRMYVCLFSTKRQTCQQIKLKYFCHLKNGANIFFNRFILTEVNKRIKMGVRGLETFMARKKLYHPISIEEEVAKWKR